jgi:hypothetical protein
MRKQKKNRSKNKIKIKDLSAGPKAKGVKGGWGLALAKVTGIKVTGLKQLSSVL